MQPLWYNRKHICFVVDDAVISVGTLLTDAFVVDGNQSDGSGARGSLCDFRSDSETHVVLATVEPAQQH